MLYTIGKIDSYDRLLKSQDKVMKGVGGYAYTEMPDAVEEAKNLAAGKAKRVGLPAGKYAVYAMLGTAALDVEMLDRVDQNGEPIDTIPVLKEPRRIIGKRWPLARVFQDKEERQS